MFQCYRCLFSFPPETEMAKEKNINGLCFVCRLEQQTKWQVEKRFDGKFN